MTEDLLDYWIRMIKPLSPANAWIAPKLSGSDYLIQIDWKLTGNTHQSNRRSRKIEIIIKEETIEDYLNKSKDERALSDIKMKQWITEKYHHFNLDQDTPASNSISPDKWRMTKDVIN